MIPFRLWGWVCWSWWILFAIISLHFFFSSPVVKLLVSIALGLMILFCSTGAFLGIAMIFKPIRMRCPSCGKKSTIGGSKKTGMWLDCETCGAIKMRIRPLGPKFVPFDSD